jgi:predicted dehydrogenase
MPLRAILVGAGRMGLTHMAQLNLLTDFGIRWTVIEPSAAVRAGLGFFLPADMLEATASAPEKAKGRFDLALITSPTMHHDAAWQALKGRAGRVFVEKPLRVARPEPHLLCGYVLLHHPLQQRLRTAIGTTAVTAVRLQLRANTVLGPNSGWRGRKSAGGGVLNEFGSHLLSLALDLAGPVDTLDLVEAATIHSVDVPDRARLAGRSAAGAALALLLDWTDPDVRKPTYSVEVTLADGRALAHDFYEFVEGDIRVSIAELPSNVPVYLRGLEFTAQARHFLEAPSFDRELDIAVGVDRLLERMP